MNVTRKTRLIMTKSSSNLQILRLKIRDWTLILFTTVKNLYVGVSIPWLVKKYNVKKLLIHHFFLVYIFFF